MNTVGQLSHITLCNAVLVSWEVVAALALGGGLTILTRAVIEPGPGPIIALLLSTSK